MSRGQYRRRKPKPKYILRRVLLLALVVLVVGLGGWGIYTAISSRKAPAAEPSSPQESLSQSSSQPVPESQPAPESEAKPESEEKPETVPSSQSQSPAAPGAGSQDWKLVLVNPTHAIAKEPDIQLKEVGGYQFDSRIVQPIEELLAAAKADGVNLTIISGYRTMARSKMLYENKIAEYKKAGYDEATAKKESARWVAPPGTSEHHTGLAMDIVSAGYYNKYTDLVEAFAQDAEAIWLKENAPRFGFVLRFAKDKEKITGINFEPWHFRYVGTQAAKEMTEKGLCLEEYVGAA